MWICSYGDLVKNFITDIFASLTFDIPSAGILVDPLRFLNIHIRDRIVILCTMLTTCLEYGAPDIDPVHVVVLMELPVLTVWAGIYRI